MRPVYPKLLSSLWYARVYSTLLYVVENVQMERLQS